MTEILKYNVCYDCTQIILLFTHYLIYYLTYCYHYQMIVKVVEVSTRQQISVVLFTHKPILQSRQLVKLSIDTFFRTSTVP